MYTIQHLSHTADTRLHLSADSREDLFRAGFAAMNEILKPGTCSKPCPCIIRRKVELSSVDATTLLIDFLSEVLTLAHEEKAIFCELDFQQWGENSLRASIGGRPANGFEEDIKAVTYHEANVQQKAGGQWETLLIFDI